MMRARAERPPRDGYILVAVLGVMLLLTGFMVAGSLLVRSALGTAKVEDTEGAMVGLTQGGLELTAYQLFVIKADPELVAGRRVRFGGGTVAPHIDDEGGKADLNGSDPKLLAGAFVAARLDQRVAADLLAYVIKMRGTKQNPSGDGPAPADPVQGSIVAPQPTVPDDQKMLRGFQSVDQLRDFTDLSASDMRALRPLLTVFNPDGKINMRSASPEMLGAIPGMSAAEVSTILRRRKEAPEREIDTILGQLEKAQMFMKKTYGPAFTVRIDATSAKGRKKAVNAVLAASKSPNDPYYVLDWWE